jgi:hypothetical protein
VFLRRDANGSYSNEDRAASIAAGHLAATRRSTLAAGTSSARAAINANLAGGIDLARRQA